MWKVLLGVVLALVLAGCGDGGGTDSGTEPAPSPSTSWSRCPDSGDLGLVTLRADLDGNGGDESVDYMDAADCPDAPALSADVDGRPVTAQVDGDLPVRDGDLQAVQIPGHRGEVLLVEQHHPRGGFQVRLFGYADGELEELTVDGEPVFDFVATDALTNPTAATCTAEGFEVMQARAHEPVGIVPAWDVDRTTYAVDGNTVTKGATTEVADSVLDRQLHSKYSALVDYSLFENCRVPH